MRPEWSKDALHTHVTVTVSFWDRLRILFGRKVFVDIDIECENVAGRTETKSVVWVEAFRKSKPVIMVHEGSATAEMRGQAAVIDAYAEPTERALIKALSPHTEQMLEDFRKTVMSKRKRLLLVAEGGPFDGEEITVDLDDKRADGSYWIQQHDRDGRRARAFYVVEDGRLKFKEGS